MTGTLVQRRGGAGGSTRARAERRPGITPAPANSSSSPTSPARGGGAPVLPALQARRDVLDVSPLGHWDGPPFPPGAPVSLAASGESVAHDMDDPASTPHTWSATRSPAVDRPRAGPTRPRALGRRACPGPPSRSCGTHSVTRLR